MVASASLETAWPGQVVVYDPKVGEVRGHHALERNPADSYSPRETNAGFDCVVHHQAVQSGAAQPHSEAIGKTGFDPGCPLRETDAAERVAAGRPEV